MLEVQKYSQVNIPLAHGYFDFTVYRNNSDDIETVVISRGNLRATAPVFTRIHSECMTSEVFGSKKCDCKNQLDLAMERIQELGVGLIIYLRQEGRGIGLGNKIKAYELQRHGLDTIEANHHLGFPTDLRDFTLAGLILKDLKVHRIDLNTNNPDKINAMKDCGIEVESISPSITPMHSENKSYLKTKYDSLGHALKPLFENREVRGNLGEFI